MLSSKPVFEKQSRTSTRCKSMISGRDRLAETHVPRENAELKSQIAFAKELSRPTKYQSPISQHHSAFVPASRLAAVPEEDMMEQDVPRARPGYATPVLTRDENGASSSKRMRTGPMGPGSAHRSVETIYAAVVLLTSRNPALIPLMTNNNTQINIYNVNRRTFDLKLELPHTRSQVG